MGSVTAQAVRPRKDTHPQPRRGRCPACGTMVVKVTLPGGRPLLVDHPELRLTEDSAPAGLLVAVTGDGDARPYRAPGTRVEGEALHSVHELGCQRTIEAAA